MELTVPAAAASAETVAAALRAALEQGPEAFRGCLGSLYADRVELRHEPALSVDGPVDGRRLAETTEAEAAAITSALGDQHYGAGEVVVDGDTVTVRTSLEGSLPSGEAASLPTHMICGVADGRIAAITHQMGPDAMQAWLRVAEAGGLVVGQPTERT
ncbi:MAG TPA: nuclear transport factor 2 family protein [Acidimicrobiales bacterium]|nr:nuclear transport factor 2 family protein [Acidimicrobiales bacterium]